MKQTRTKQARLWRPPVDAVPDAAPATPSFRRPTGLLGWVADVAQTAVEKISEHVDTDRALQHATAAVIELAGTRYALSGPEQQWQPGQPLRLLLAGYNGTRNTGGDVRVEEMVRQFRHLFGDDHVELSVLTFDPELTRGYFRACRQLHMPKIFPKFLYDTIGEQHGVIACEGSMFKSKFANALSTMMVGALGLAAAEQKLAVGYGGEAGHMDDSLRDFVAKYAADAFVICRNRASQGVLSKLGIRSKFGTDTAWTFEPPDPSIGPAILRSHGWDGHTPVLAVCPINAYWWPVKPDLVRAALRPVSEMDADLHYGSVYFHADSAAHQDKQDRYIDALATAVKRYTADNDAFVVIAGSEQLDRPACEALDQALGGGNAILVSDEHDMYEMVAALRQASLLLSSRYHAIVMTMGAGVPSAGVTMDERIANLMTERGHEPLCMRVDDEDLAERAYQALVTLRDERTTIVDGIERCVAANLERMGTMGMHLVDHVKQQLPEFPFDPRLGGHGDPWEHLPPLSQAQRALLDRRRS